MLIICGLMSVLSGPSIVSNLSFLFCELIYLRIMFKAYNWFISRNWRKYMLCFIKLTNACVTLNMRYDSAVRNVLQSFPGDPCFCDLHVRGMRMAYLSNSGLWNITYKKKHASKTLIVAFKILECYQRNEIHSNR